MITDTASPKTSLSYLQVKSTHYTIYPGGLINQKGYKNNSFYGKRYTNIIITFAPHTYLHVEVF